MTDLQELHRTNEPRVEQNYNFCPLLDASLMMLWHDMAYVEMYVSQDFKKSFKCIMYMLTFYHTRCVSIISEVTEMSNTII